MSAIDLATLIVSATKEAILQKMLDVASGVGLETESWRTGDPTRALFYSTAARFEEWEAEGKIPGFIRSGFLGLASGDWLKLKVEQDYNVTPRAATYATCTVRVTNGSAANIGAIAVGDLTVAHDVTGLTYRNTSGDTLGPGPGVYVDLEFTAEQAGSDSNAGVGDITTLVTTLAGVTVSNLTAATATDEEEDDELRLRTQAKIESFSPNGPKGAYHYAATTALPESGKAITSAIQAAIDYIDAGDTDLARQTLADILVPPTQTNVTRTRVIADSELGEVTVYLAGASGAVTGGDVTTATDAIDTWATPLCTSVTVASASNVTLAVTYTLWVYETIAKTSAEIKEIVEDYLTAAIKERPIGGDVTPPATTGSIYKDWVEAQILAAVYPYGYRVSVSAPSGDTALTINQVAVLGTVTPTINLVEEA